MNATIQTRRRRQGNGDACAGGMPTTGPASRGGPIALDRMAARAVRPTRRETDRYTPLPYEKSAH